MVSKTTQDFRKAIKHETFLISIVKSTNTLMVFFDIALLAYVVSGLAMLCKHLNGSPSRIIVGV